jgi:hypothetical protein
MVSVMMTLELRNMKESQEIVDYLEIDFAQKLEHGSRLVLSKEDFSVSFKAIVGCDGHPRIYVEFIPPEDDIPEFKKISGAKLVKEYKHGNL